MYSFLPFYPFLIYRSLYSLNTNFISPKQIVLPMLLETTQQKLSNTINSLTTL